MTHRRHLLVVAATIVAGLSLTNWASADNVRGAFSPVGQWPLIGVHTVLLPDGRVLTYGTKTDGTQTGFFDYDVWDPGAGAMNLGHLTLSNQTGTDIFCGSQVVLPTSSRVFLAGGDILGTNGRSTNVGNNNTNLFDPLDNSLNRGNNMHRARWYSTSTVLLNGEVYIQGGNGGADRPEVRQTDGSFRLLTNVNTSGLSWEFPRNYLAPDGRVFGYDSGGNMYFVNPAGTGTYTAAGSTPSNVRGGDSTSAMFRPGRILQLGGGSNGAVVIDINGATPVVTATANMATQRKLANASVMADGKVVVTGGSTVWNQLTGVNRTAEMWDPVTGQWTVGATGARARLYHSGSILLPDASVLVIGGGAPGPETNLNAEIFYPPYLYDAAGQLAPRPAITSAPGAVEIGQVFRMDFADAAAVSRVTLVKTASVTHSYNMEQRFADLTFTSSGSRLTIQAPARAAQAPPGYYMLFVLDDRGVPSRARIVRIGVAPNPNPAVTPVLQNPGDRSDLAGAIVALQLQATDPNGDALGYGASGLPPGVSLDNVTGLISGAPNVAGTYNVTLAVSDGINSDTETFVWTVAPSLPLIVSELPPQPAVSIGGATTWVATASNAINARYQWNFGDGSGDTPWSEQNSASHTYAAPGLYLVTVRVVDDRGIVQTQTITQRVHLPLPAGRPVASSQLALLDRGVGNDLLWVVNPDNNSVSAFDTVTRARLAEVPVGAAPRTLAIAPDGRVWVVNRDSASLSVVDSNTFTVTRSIALRRGSRPYGAVLAADGSAVFVVSEAYGQLQKIDTVSGNVLATLALPLNFRHVSLSADGTQLLVTRFVTGRLPGEHTANVETTVGGTVYGAEVRVIAASDLSQLDLIVLKHSDLPDFENSGAGIPNYLGAAVISPDGQSAWVPSKQDNIKRGVLRNGSALNFQNTVRAVSSRIVLGSNSEDLGGRIDHDNSSMASAAAFDPDGVYLFVALETSREVAVVDAHAKVELFRIPVGRAPQALVVAPDGRRLYVSNFMDRSVSVLDLSILMATGAANVPVIATLSTVATERLSAQVLLGKQLFYDARDPRLARDAYMSCASCHNDGGQDGRVWDLTGFGEGLRNTVSLEGRAAGQGFLHWSANFDELQDFEGQIRTLAGGSGLMSDTDFNAGTRSQPLGDRKTGLSANLDALAAYVASLSNFAVSPYRNSNGSLTTEATAGRAVFVAKNCAQCHSGTHFTASQNASALVDIGTLQPSSGQRLGGVLAGIDPPTLRDVWRTGPWLHNGSALTLQQAVAAHTNVSLTPTELDDVVAYVREVGSEELVAPGPSGNGLVGQYFNNKNLTGNPVLTRVEAVNFNWGTGSPAVAVNSNQFSVRWTGFLQVPTSGAYRLRTYSDDGIRVWLNGSQIINNWTDHAPTNNTSGTVNLTAGQRYSLTIEYYENGGGAVAQLRWRLPNTTGYQLVPASQLFDQ